MLGRPVSSGASGFAPLVSSNVGQLYGEDVPLS